mmetsp:Transcript_11457/g.24049  ORF Transcript_11457/g.24049 Transcript_11457/m.24049 type:complete len:210 (-) Transcript_11457:8-637(-)
MEHAMLESKAPGAARTQQLLGIGQELRFGLLHRVELLLIQGSKGRYHPLPNQGRLAQEKRLQRSVECALEVLWSGLRASPGKGLLHDLLGLLAELRHHVTRIHLCLQWTNLRQGLVQRNEEAPLSPCLRCCRAAQRWSRQDSARCQGQERRGQSCQQGDPPPPLQAPRRSSPRRERPHPLTEPAAKLRPAGDEGRERGAVPRRRGGRHK